MPFIFFMLVGFITNAQSKYTIINKDSNTNGITKMQFEEHNANRVYVRIWAECTPNDCFWGNFLTRKDISYPEYLQRVKGNWIPYYHPIKINESFVERQVTIYQHRTRRTRYKVTLKNDYKSSNRTDTSRSYYFARQ